MLCEIGLGVLMPSVIVAALIRVFSFPILLALHLAAVDIAVAGLVISEVGAAGITAGVHRLMRYGSTPLTTGGF